MPRYELKVAFLVAVIFHVVLLSIAFPEVKEHICKPKLVMEVSLVKCIPDPGPPVPKKKPKPKKVKKKIVPKPKPIPKKVIEDVVAEKYVETKKELPVVQPDIPDEIDAEKTGSGFTSLARPAYGTRTIPRYPKLARRRGYQGVVMLKVLVSEKGKVEEIEVDRTSGYSILDTSAVKQVKTWRFIPAMQGTKPVSCWVEIPVRYQLLGG